MKRKINLKRWIANILAAVVLLQLAPVVPVSFAAGEQHGVLGDLHVDCYPHIIYTLGANPGDETYELQLELNAEFYEHAINTDPAAPARGYFTTNYDGWYLVELWGGDGADGPADSDRQGGTGGTGGYVYGKVYLKAGQTLYYSLGGDGRYTYVSGEGGGANGGGNGGSTVTYGVGGGGGYSALFLFPETEGSNTFANLYLDDAGKLKSDNISEYDRATKYLMIAGGGGGGGAADGASLNSSSGSRRPNGGNGGNMDAAVKGTIVGDGLTVAGTFYAGGDGQFSGNSDAYIGHGGTSTPGEIASTAWSWSSGEKPNDWTGAYNNATPGGSGGAGNLRGGSGGGGFCGGSGGIQQSLVTATNVGGGGGGSSFVAAKANEYCILTNRTDDAATGITDAEYAILDKVNNEAGCTGGRVAITYLAGEHLNDDITKAQNLDVSFTVSPYFNVSDLAFSQLRHEEDAEGNATGNTNVSYDPSTGLITLKGLSLVPTSTNLAGNLTVSLTFTPKERFRGGNDVPLLVGDKVTVAVAGTDANAAVDNTTKCEISLDKDLCYVNVPLKFSVDVRNHTYTSTGAADWSVSLTPDQMHNTAADTEREESITNRDPMYAFIQSATPCTVAGMTGSTEISATTVFPVSFTVEPTNNAGINPAFGPATIPTTVFTSDATVTILAPHDGYIHGQKMQFVKNLSANDDDSYTFSLTTSASNTKTSHRPEYNYDPSNASAGSAIPIEHNGVYLVQVWGGSGNVGVGASGLLGSASGGSGGTGGYSYAYLTLEAGDKLIVDQMGRLGSAAVSNSGGGGGTYTAVRVDYKDSAKTDEILVIAGGGGGGGNGAIGGIGLGFIKADGGNGTSAGSTAYSTLDNPLSAYNGGTGGVGSNKNGTATAGTGGSAGSNYYSANAYRDYDVSQFPKEDHNEDGVDDNPFTADDLAEYLSQTTNPTTETGGGAVRVICLRLNNHEHVAADLQNYTLQLQFSPYFTIRQANGAYAVGQNNKEGLDAEQKVLDHDAITFTNQLLTVPNINPYQETVTTPGDVTSEYHSKIDFTISVVLEPKAGFLGGNNVPVLSYTANAALPTGGRMQQTKQTGDGAGMDEASVGMMEHTDFANVPLHTANIDLGTLMGHDVHLEQDSDDKNVTRSQLYTWDPSWTAPSGDDAWTGDFVQRVEIVGEIATPTVDVGWTSKVHETNAHYDVTVGVGPTSQAKDGIVGDAAANYTLPRERANVYVRPRMIYALTGVETSHEVGPDQCESMDPSATFEVTLVPQTGYDLPASIAIYYNDASGNPDTEAPVTFAYDSATGKVTILPGAITKSMTLQAVGAKKSYKIYFGHEVLGSTDPKIYSETLEYGATIGTANAALWEGKYRPSDIPGYDFAWNWRTGMETPDNPSDDGKVPATMPAYDLWVVGEYTPKEYTLRIEYGWADGVTPPATPLPSVYTQVYRFGETFNVASPAITGYAADPLFVTDTIDAELVAPLPDNGIDPVYISREVLYSPTQNQLRIDYVVTDTGETTVYKATLNTDAEYSVAIPQKEGYTSYIRNADNSETEATVVAGKMTAEGVSVIVLYRPNTYQVTFSFAQNDQSNPGSCTETSRTVTFNAEYGETTPLPTQVLRDGYEFAGWYLADGEGNPTGERINSDTIVATAADHTLVAKWTAKKYALVIEHVYADGSKAAETQTMMVDYGAPFNDYCKPLNLGAGYKAYVMGDNGQYIEVPDEIPGKMPAQTVVRTFYYIGKECTLTIHYKYANGTEAEDTYVSGLNGNPALRFGESFSIESPQVSDGADGYLVCSQPVVSGTMDNMNGKEYTVYYYTNSPVFNVTITWGPDDDVMSAMQYAYDWGIWDPESHTYQNYSINPVKDNANRIKVSNNGSTMGNANDAPALNIDASLTYAPSGDYSYVSGAFTGTNDRTADKIMSLPGIVTGSPQSAWLWLTGEMPTTVSGVLPVGRCVVSITAAGGGS